MNAKRVIAWGLCAVSVCSAVAAPNAVSGVYPQLATFNNEGECGTGAVVPWAGSLWVISYGPHCVQGSSDKLYEITENLQQIIRPESVGGTHANRLIHKESNQLIIGCYVIDAQKKIRVISPKKTMPGRLTGTARHVTDPTNKVYFATMEEGLYEVDVNTLAVKTLIRDGNKASIKPNNWELAPGSELPGYHGKGLYSGFGKVFYANNGEHGKEAQTRPDVPSGAFAEWTGSGDWKLIRRNQFTEITGPGGIYGNPNPQQDPIWSLGWDYRSVILMANVGGTWTSYRLPKHSHCYDGAHGWNTEWPRIRDVGGSDLLMTMHGAFWHFPKNFTPQTSAGIAPYSSYLKVIGDFCAWKGRIVMGCDDSAKSEFLNTRKAKGELKAPGQSQSNLWFVDPAQLNQFGPSVGRGAVWSKETVRAHVASDPYLFSGFDRRMLWIKHSEATPVEFTIEVDQGNGTWSVLRKVMISGEQNRVVFTPAEKGAWVRLTASRDCKDVTAQFLYSNADKRSEKADAIFDGIAAQEPASKGLLHISSWATKKLRLATTDKQCFELDETLTFKAPERPNAQATVAKDAPIPQNVIQSDAASLIYPFEGGRWRIPRGCKDAPATTGRISREVCTERDMFNAGGIFYELPAENAGGFAKVRPIATHNRAIYDYASYRGLMAISGIDAATRSDRIVRTADGKHGVWVGVADDLWKFGKARGVGGPWLDSAVKAGAVSDPYLATGFDKKTLTLKADKAVQITLEADIDGTGNWVPVQKFTLTANETKTHVFDDAFAAYWLRVVSDVDCTATAQLLYE